MSNNPTFGWMADTHIGYTQYGMVRRRKDFDLAFMEAVKVFQKAGVNEILHCGDIIHSNRPGPEDIIGLFEVQNFLIQHGMTMYVISGNHDYSNPHWLDVVKEQNPSQEFGFKLVDWQTFTMACGVTVFGMPFSSIDAFKSTDFPPADVLMMHQPVKEFVNFPGSNTLAIDDLPINKYKAILMGDIHVDQNMQVQRKGLPDLLIGYPGSTEMNSESEDENKSVKIVTMENGLPVLETVYIKTRNVFRFEIMTEADMAAAMEVVDNLQKQMLADPELRGPMLFVRYANVEKWKVIERFHARLDPNRAILRPSPVLVEDEAGKDEPILVDDKAVVDVDSLLRIQLEKAPHLYDVASRMLIRDLDPGKVLEDYIEARLHETTTDRAPAAA